MTASSDLATDIAATRREFRRLLFEAHQLVGRARELSAEIQELADPIAGPWAMLFLDIRESLRPPAEDAFQTRLMPWGDRGPRSPPGGGPGRPNHFPATMSRNPRSRQVLCGREGWREPPISRPEGSRRATRARSVNCTRELRLGVWRLSLGLCPSAEPSQRHRVSQPGQCGALSRA